MIDICTLSIRPCIRRLFPCVQLHMGNLFPCAQLHMGTSHKGTVYGYRALIQSIDGGIIVLLWSCVVMSTIIWSGHNALMEHATREQFMDTGP